MNKQYSENQKNEVIEMYLSGVSVSDLSKQTGVARNTIYSWIKKSKSTQKALKRINMRDVIDLRQKCAQLEKMVEILQSVPCTVSAPLRERYIAIEQLTDQYSVNLLCKALKVAKGSYYNHILRNKNENTIFEQKKKELNSVMESFFKSMKTEKLYRTDFRSEREIREAIRDYVHYYNSKRPHSVIQYRTPDAYEADYFKRQAALQDL